MDTELAVTVNAGRQIVRTPEELAPLIKEQVALGDIASEEAGMPYYRKAGSLMLEARKPVKDLGEETFTEFCERVTGKSYPQCKRYMAAHEEQKREANRIENARKKGRTVRPRPLSDSLQEVTGETSNGRVYREWTGPVDDFAERARAEQAKRGKEQNRKQELARRLIDIGFKVLATELHPDKMGGSEDAMTRLNEVRNRLRQVYG
jgi:hypothetical protein